MESWRPSYGHRQRRGICRIFGVARDAGNLCSEQYCVIKCGGDTRSVHDGMGCTRVSSKFASRSMGPCACWCVGCGHRGDSNLQGNRRLRRCHMLGRQTRCMFGPWCRFGDRLQNARLCRGRNASNARQRCECRARCNWWRLFESQRRGTRFEGLDRAGGLDGWRLDGLQYRSIDAQAGTIDRHGFATPSG